MPEKDFQRCLTKLAPYIQPSPSGEESITFNHGLHFTGGEPFLNFDLLLNGVRMAHELAIPSLFVETNCFWCVKDEETLEKIDLLKKAGLQGILISVNPFYAEFIPFERTERCIRISRQVFGPNVMVYQWEYYERFQQLSIRKRISLEEYAKLDPYLTRSVELLLMGRATNKLREFYRSYPACVFFREPCLTPFLHDWHNHFDNYGNFMPGYCGGISLGSWKNLDALIQEGIDLEEHPVLKLLIKEDLEGLFHFAKDLGYQESPDGYISKCDLCLDLRKYLVSQKEFSELQPKEFYEQINT